MNEKSQNEALVRLEPPKFDQKARALHLDYEQHINWNKEGNEIEKQTIALLVSNDSYLKMGRKFKNQISQNSLAQIKIFLFHDPTYAQPLPPIPL